ncbi:TauD/TfdA family dioxygenase [Saccharopolyspora hirsuta]|uniref:TauD/TfdA family dioxygenase n=1 Tax=Saccharopolyspora hirsuta TaxID=1837 RepID=UPI001FE8BC34|nr:TauD/TfdA family dioxygenase [Saccharopolyspora hirsuta]
MKIFEEAGRTPVVQAPDAPAGPGWVAEHRAALHELVDDLGAFVIRGTGVSTVDHAVSVSRALAAPLLPEKEGFARRRTCADGVYSSSEWPANQPMCMHQELSYALRCPGLLVVTCLRAPESGGGTGVADAGAVFEALPADLVDRFEREGWQLVRNYGGAIGMPWQEAFGTEDRSEVERYCRDNAIDFEWDGDSGLRTTQRRRAVIAHPRSARRLWFNQIAFLSEWTMQPEVREYLVAELGPDGLPFTSRYGSGEPIEPDVVDLINEVYEKHTRCTPWQDGDVLVVDNLACAHSREPYRGDREVLVAMGSPQQLPAHSPTTASA